ncbi:MAG: adenosylmethionine--8-amino-7-oxononanoate transaminase [Rikenellaceae bacterium]
MKLTRKNLLDYDREHIWHPYTSMINPLPVYEVKSAKGAIIKLADGRKLIDGMSSWWSTVHGYNNKRLNKALLRQVKQVSHVMFGGLTHEPAVSLAQKLINITPEGLNRVFYCDSGSVSVEVAIKMAIQYMYASGKKDKNKIATFLGGYHGDTWHAMSVCDPQGGMHSMYSGRLPLQYFAPKPSVAFSDVWHDEAFEQTAEMIEQNHESIAAFILEPIVQGAGGMWFYHPNYIKKLSEICKKYDILIIADEIATGFGRTGKLFASEWAEFTPDIMCLGKAITGGYMSFAAVMATDNVAMTISGGSPSELMHGPTFMGNPLACALACEAVDMITEPGVLDRIKEIETILTEELAGAKNHEGVQDVRVLGAIGVVEMKERVDMASLQAKFVSEGVWIRPFGTLIYIMPQYIILDKQLRTLARALVKCL